MLDESKADLETNEYLFDPRVVPPEERVLGRFRLLHELGTGGMATLHLALDEVGGLTAVKRLHPHLAAERRFVQMFGDEAVLAARINHPNVCKVHDLEREAGFLFIPMEYVHGECLAALLRQLSVRGQLLPVEVALHLAGQVCLGLQAVHELVDPDERPLHLVHRDICPQNLLVTYDGELKIVDFGIAGAVAKEHRTETGAVKGKVSYMAPEQARGADVDRRADLFSLGVVLYEAVCGARCFPGANAADTLRRAQAAEFVPPLQHRPDLPDAARQIITRALARRPQDRYPSAAEMYRDLYSVLVSLQVGVNTRFIGDLMKRVFVRRYALREELLSLAFAAPAVLEEEGLNELLELSPRPRAVRCEHCGERVSGEDELSSHRASCAQRSWWVHNFGGEGQVAGAGDAAELRRRVAADREESREGLWQRIRRRFTGKRDPLVVRLEVIDARLASVRDHQAGRLAGRGLASLWGMVAEISDKSSAERNLLSLIKPRLLCCGDMLLALTLEIESSSAYLAAGNGRRLQDQVEMLRERGRRSTSPAVSREIERNIQRKRALIAERTRLRTQVEVLQLRLESMVDAIELTHGKILQITSSPVVAEREADTQITVFLDSMLQEVKLLDESLQELDEHMSRPG